MGPAEDVPSLESNPGALAEFLGVLVFSTVSSEDLCASFGGLLWLRLENSQRLSPSLPAVFSTWSGFPDVLAHLPSVGETWLWQELC